MGDDIEAKISKLHIIDDRIRSIWTKFSEVQLQSLSESRRVGPWYKECVFPAGSEVEGGMYARIFRRGKLITEADFMFRMGFIPKPESQLQPIEGFPGYLSVKFDGILNCFRDGIREKFLESCQTEGGNISSFVTRSSVMNMTRNMFSSTAQKSRANEFAADAFLQPDIPSQGTVSFEQKGPSVLLTVSFTSGENHLTEVRVDTVPCFKLSCWPDAWGFEEFKNRLRKWPSDLEKVEAVQYKVYIVPKPSPQLKDESESNTCWRLSFSDAEMHLKSLFTKDEDRIYLLFKILYYVNIKKVKVGGKALASYLCKTTMLWMMEEEGEELCKIDLSQAIQKLFQKFKQFLDSENGLPNFFCPSMNLLKVYPEELITECSKVAGDISERPFEYFPSNFDECCDRLNKVLARLDEIQFEDFVDTLGDYIKTRLYLKGYTAVELFWHWMQPRNWRVRLFFHPFVRAVTRVWARRRCLAIRDSLPRCVCCLPYHRNIPYETFA